MSNFSRKAGAALVATLLLTGVSAAHTSAAFAAPEVDASQTTPGFGDAGSAPAIPSTDAPADPATDSSTAEPSTADPSTADPSTTEGAGSVPAADPATDPAQDPATDSTEAPAEVLAEVPAPASAQRTAPAPAPLAAADGVATSTVGEMFLEPRSYGHGMSVTGTVTLDGPSFIMGAPINVLIDGVVKGTGVLIYIGEGKYWALIPVLSHTPAGTHEVVVSFPGYSSGIPFMKDALPSESQPMTITIAQGATTTEITSAPASSPAFSPVDVTAQVTRELVVPGGLSALDGNAALLADGEPIATAALGTDGAVAFDDVVVPFGTTELTAEYLGDEAGNYAVSASEPSPIEITELATDTELGLSANHVRAGDPVTLTATVRNISDANQVDPRSGIEFLVDGDVIYTEVSADEPDASPGDGTTQFQYTVSDTLLGEHDVTARFLPVPGFTASESEPVTLQVDGIETEMTPKSAQLRGTIAKPAVAEVDVTALPAPVETAPVETDPVPLADSAPAASAAAGAAAVAAPAGPEINGYVQAYFGDEPIGEPFQVEDGVGSGPITELGVGTHQVELRFTPGTYGLFGSSATVVVTVDAAPGPEPKPEPQPNPQPGPAPTPGDGGKAAGLAATGGDASPALAITGLGLLAAAGLALTLAKRRRSA